MKVETVNNPPVTFTPGVKGALAASSSTPKRRAPLTAQQQKQLKTTKTLRYPTPSINGYVAEAIAWATSVDSIASTNSMWSAVYSDFGWCHDCRQIYESIRCHSRKDYGDGGGDSGKDYCSKCLRQSFVRTLPKYVQAVDNTVVLQKWLDIWAQKSEGLKPQQKEAHANAWMRTERDAWLTYAFSIHILATRLRALVEEEETEDIIAWKQELKVFNDQLLLRSGNKLALKGYCATHDVEGGDGVPWRKNNQYQACGVCPIPREVKQMHLYDNDRRTGGPRAGYNYSYAL